MAGETFLCPCGATITLRVCSKREKGCKELVGQCGPCGRKLHGWWLGPPRTARRGQ